MALNGKSIIILGLLLLLVALPATAWDGHDIITRYALQGMTDQFPGIEAEREFAYADWDQSTYNPEFKVRYELSDTTNLSGYQVLVTYAPEPDWEMDSNQDLDRRQILTGGSQGWRHQRYTLLNGRIVLGVAPERAEHFYRLALRAVQEGDLYWGYRFLARSLHYLQDMGQPFHSLPLPVSDLITKHMLNIGRATKTAENVHFNLESYGEYCLAAGDEKLIAALKGREYVHIADVKQAAIELNTMVRQIVLRQYELVLAIWPKLAESRTITLDFTSGDLPEDSPELTELKSIMADTLELTAQYSRGLIRKFLADSGAVAR